MSKPCIVCGVPSPESRCADHQLPVHSGTPNTDHPAYANGTRWKNLSRRLRRQQPFCELCGGTERLSVDHIVRFKDRPDWAYEKANLRVICLPCNSSLANVPATKDTERIIATKIGGRTPAPSPAPTPPGSRGDNHTLESFNIGEG